MQDVPSAGSEHRVLWIEVKVLQQDCLAERWLVVQARTTVAVATRTDLEVKRTVYPDNQQRIMLAGID